MPKFRKKPVEVEAVQWFRMGDHPKVVDGYQRIDSRTKTGLVVGDHSERGTWRRGCPVDQVPVIKTLEGWHRVSEGDWIITGVNGEHYPCKPDIFEQTYEAV
mgnify:CR=1 FL=1